MFKCHDNYADAAREARDCPIVRIGETYLTVGVGDMRDFDQTSYAVLTPLRAAPGDSDQARTETSGKLGDLRRSSLIADRLRGTLR